MDPQRRTLADIMGIERDAIYLFRADQSRPKRLLAAGTTLIEWAEVAPDLQTVAYGFTYPDPKKIDVVPERRVSGVGIVDASGIEQLRIIYGRAVGPSGVEHLRVIGGRAAAWSPSGRRLAILVPRKTRAGQDTVHIWDRSSRNLVSHRLATSEGLAWRSNEMLVTGTNILNVSTGDITPSGHAGHQISPDQQYSMASYSHGPGIWFDAGKLDITQSVAQVCGAMRLKHVQKSVWVSGRGEGHMVALGVVEDTTARTEKPRDPNITSIIDVSIPELLETIPGRLVGLASDWRTLVLLRQDGIHFVPPRSGRRASRSAMAYGSGVGPHPAKAWIEMATIRWSHKVVMDHTDTLEVRTFSVALGDPIKVEGYPFLARDRSAAFRVVAIRSNGSVLMECVAGLVPAGQTLGKGFGHRFIVTPGPIHVGTASYDGGEVFLLRIVPESLAKERLRNGTATRRGQSRTTMMGQPYTPKPDTTFDQPPRLLAQAPAWLPKPWRKDQYERLVYVMAVVDTNGHVSNPRLVLTSPPDIEAAILQAAKRCTFKPAQKRGRPVPTGWGFNVELKHPRSHELAASDSSSVAWSADENIGVRIRASAYYDSVDEKYCYSYALENRSKSPSRVTSLTLSGCATGANDGDERPEKWNGYFCGSNPGVQGWIIWERDPAEGVFGYATMPGAWLAPMKFKSRAPPGRVQWLAKTATDKNFTYAMPCSPPELDPLGEGSLSGTIVGPVSSASPEKGGR